MFVVIVAGLLLVIRLHTKWEQLQESTSTFPTSAGEPWSIVRGRRNLPSDESGDAESSASVADAEAKTMGRRWDECEFYFRVVIE